MARSSTDTLGNQPFLITPLRTPKEAFRNVRNYLAGQFVGATRDDTLLDEVLKCLFCKLYVETSDMDTPPPGADLFEQARFMRAVFAKVRKDFRDIYPPDAEILLDPEAINYVLAECNFSLLDAGADPIGDAFEVFVGSESRSRAGQFFTPQVVTDFLVQSVNPRPGETVIDPACGAGGFLASVCRHHKLAGVGTEELASLASETIFGVDKDDYLVKLAKLHISLLTKGHPRIVCGDSLSMQNGGMPLRDYFPQDGFDVLFANPPFGTRIVAANADVLRTFQLARKWVADRRSDRLVPSDQEQAKVPPQVLFVERCLSLLRAGGRMGIVLPESVLSNKSYRHVVQYLLDNASVRAVIGMPESLFKTSGKGGTHTKTCLVIAERGGGGRNKIFMAEAKWCGHDSRARAIPHNDLPDIQKNFSVFRKGRLKEETVLGFTVDQARVTSNVLCPRYYDPQMNSELSGLEKTHTLLPFGELVGQKILSVATGDELGKLAYGTGDIPFIRTSDISNWEIKSDPKHGVSREIYEGLKAKQDVRPFDLLMVKDGTYLIGTCAIITEKDREIVYQSHLYKIRVNENRLGLNPFLLLAILSSPVVQRQVRSKQFTMDIIDSLGERINELVLPVPRSKDLRDRITEMVSRAVAQRIEARELARQARLAVAPL